MFDRWLNILISFWIAGPLLVGGCASGPEPSADMYTESEASDEDSGEIPAPLQEQDRLAKAEEKQIADRAAEDAKQERREVSDNFITAIGQANRNPARARQLMKDTLKRQPSCYKCAYNLGVFYEKEGKWSEAAEAYRKALSVQPTHVPTVINLSNLQIRLGKVGQGKKVVEKAVRKAPNDIDLRGQLIRVLLATRSLQPAIEQAKGVLLVDERNMEVMILLAQAYYEWNKYELAERILVKAREINGKNASIHNILGFVYLKMDKPNAAIRSFKKAVRLDPGQAEARNNLGVLYQKAHDFEAATEQLRQAVAYDPGFYEAYLNLGNALRGHHSYQEAEKAYRIAQKLRPDDQRTVFNLGLMYLDDDVPGYKQADRYNMAIKQLEKFRQQGGQDPRLEKYLKEARRKYERALKTERRQLKKEQKVPDGQVKNPVSGEPGETD